MLSFRFFYLLPMLKEVIYVHMATPITNFEERGMWSGYIKKIFIDIMVIEVNRGNMENETFNSQTWKKMLNEMNVRAKWNLNLKQLKQKLHRLHAKHCEFSDLLKHTAFGWDVESNTVHALEETWQNYIRVKWLPK